MRTNIWVQLGRAGLVMVLVLIIIIPGFKSALPVYSAGPAVPEGQAPPDGIRGPYHSPAVAAAVFNGDLRDLPVPGADLPDTPGVLRYTPGQVPKDSIPQNEQWVDPVAQTSDAAGLMPSPTVSFLGMSYGSNGSGFPPDTVGDVGPAHYIQAVNTSIGIFDKTSGALLVSPALTFDEFFPASVIEPCNSHNRGDPVVVYDPVVDRWLVSDFAWVNPNSGPFYECIAVSQSSDPVSGGWYYYALPADTGGFSGYLNDYPKIGVWADGWYMSANMFQIVQPATGFGVRVWALDRAAMISGTLREVHFDCTDPECASLLPSNLRGALPPAGSPAYFLSVSAPEHLNLWQFHVDWTTPANSTFSGPVSLNVASFAQAPFVPQRDTARTLDTVSPRLMMQLQYRNLGGVESLWANHTVLSGGVAGVRWYEIRDPGGTPWIAQQSTYQPDANQRWMGSLAVDQDGNIAVGYSVSSSSMYPGIRYAGRLRGEVPNSLPQAETVLVNGTGSQTNYSRWGDYSAMSVDPADDCTFWYTQEYYITTNQLFNNWQTRIGAFKYPSCGVTKATLSGTVRNSQTNQPVAYAPVVAVSPGQTMSILADGAGTYSMQLLPGVYTLTAGPFLPGYPSSSSLPGVIASAGQTTAQDLFLSPVPELVEGSLRVDDAAGNDNGVPEPGEGGLLLYEGLRNAGGAPATNISAHLSSLTAGVSVQSANAAYADIAPGQTITNSVPFQFSVSPGVACGADLDFRKVVTDSLDTYTIDFTLNAAQPLPRSPFFSNDVENGAAGWTTGGIGSSWGITTGQSHSPTHSWSDSPSGNYADNANSYVRTPATDLSGKRHLRLSAWYRYALESGYDYVYLEYSLDGGATWSSQPLLTFNGSQSDWTWREVDASVLDGHSNIALRYRLDSDVGLNYDGFYVDDIVLTYEPYECGIKFSYLPIALK